MVCRGVQTGNILISVLYCLQRRVNGQHIKKCPAYYLWGRASDQHNNECPLLFYGGVTLANSEDTALWIQRVRISVLTQSSFSLFTASVEGRRVVAVLSYIPARN